VARGRYPLHLRLFLSVARPHINLQQNEDDQMIFLSYVSEDRDRVEPYYELLKNHGHDPWMDSKNILGGQNWDYEIRLALDRSEIIIVFVSEQSVDKKGYAQREIALAVNKSEEKLVGDIYIIPIQLDDGDYPYLLKGIQFLQANKGDVADALLASVDQANGNAEKQAQVAQTKSEVRWHTSEATSSYNGIPGYETRIQKISLSSSKYPDAAEISEHVNGALVGHAMDARQAALTPAPDIFNLLQDKWKRTNTFDGIIDTVSTVGRVISIKYSLHWYYGGAAHPTHAPKTFNYLLEPVSVIRGARTIFQDDEALGVLQRETEKSLAESLYKNNCNIGDLKWIREGTKDWDSFSNFGFTEEGLVFQFSSYQVACYAVGMPVATVGYDKVLPHMTDTFVYALNRYRA